MVPVSPRDRILIVDDEPSVLHLLEIGLSRLNCELCLAGGGEAGLAAARDLSPDLVILDILMPDLDGYEVCRTIRLFTSTPVILLTALRDSSDMEMALSAGADEYVAKPFSIADLLGRSRAALSRRRALPFDSEPPPPFAGGRFSIDVGRRLVHELPRRRGQLPIVVPLSDTAFRLVTYLASNRGRRLPYEAILERVWGPAWTGERTLLASHLGVLRQRLEVDANRPRLIVEESDRSVVFHG
jgi:two-component system KDP operon response regulator KdpE